MKKIKLLLVGSFCLIGCFVNGQEVKPLASVLNQLASNNNYINIMNRIGGADRIETNKAAEVLRMQIDGSLLPDSLLTISEKEILNNNFDALSSMFGSIKNIGGKLPNYVVVANKKQGFIYPFINVAKFKAENVLVNSGLYYDYAFNNLKTDESSRIKEVSLKLITPYVYNLKSIIKSEDFIKIVIVCGYTSRDFSDKFDHGLSETVAVVFDKNVLRSYFDAELTDSELLSQSDIIYTNKDIEGNIKKVEFNNL